MFQRLCLALGWCGVVATMAATQAVNPAGHPLVLAGGTIYPSPEAAPILDAVIVAAGGTITAVGSRGSLTIPAGATVVDCTGLFITAGFQNSHMHFTEPKWADADRRPGAVLTSQLEEMLTRYGFTTVVDTGSLLANTTALRRRIESGEVAGPRILTAGTHSRTRRAWPASRWRWPPASTSSRTRSTTRADSRPIICGG